MFNVHIYTDGLIRSECVSTVWMCVCVYQYTCEWLFPFKFYARTYTNTLTYTLWLIISVPSLWLCIEFESSVTKRKSLHSITSWHFSVYFWVLLYMYIQNWTCFSLGVSVIIMATCRWWICFIGLGDIGIQWEKEKDHSDSRLHATQQHVFSI